MLFFVFQLKNSIFVKDIDDKLTSFFEVESFFEEVKHDEAMAAFKTLMNSNNLAESCQKAHAFIQLLRLGKIEEGSVSYLLFASSRSMLTGLALKRGKWLKLKRTEMRWLYLLRQSHQNEIHTRAY